MPSRIHGKRDDFADVRFVREEHDEPVESRSHAGMRRSAVFISFDYMPEALLRLLGGEAHELEYLALHLRVRDTHASRSELVAVADEVVLLRAERIELGAAFPRRLFVYLHQPLDVLRARRGERVMRERVMVRVVIPFEEREVHD